MRVLLVEDDAALALGIQHALQREGGGVESKGVALDVADAKLAPPTMNVRSPTDTQWAGEVFVEAPNEIEKLRRAGIFEKIGHCPEENTMREAPLEANQVPSVLNKA